MISNDVIMRTPFVVIGRFNNFCTYGVMCEIPDKVREIACVCNFNGFIWPTIDRPKTAIFRIIEATIFDMRVIGAR